jgi:hypothetical protein
MVGSRTLTALAGLVVSLAVSAAIYLYTGSLLLFVLVPFIPFLFARSTDGEADEPSPTVKECRDCGFRTRDPGFEYCPRDGRRLEESSRRRA